MAPKARMLDKKFLVTGGAGFIGVNLIKALVSQAREIRVLDNLSAGRAQDLANLPVDLRVADIRDENAVDAAMAGMEVVVHLAAHTGVVDSVADPAHDLAGTANGAMVFDRNRGFLLGPRHPGTATDQRGR